MIQNPEVYDPTLAGIAMLVEIRRMAGHNWEWREGHFDLLAGTDQLRLGLDRGLGIQELRSGWLAQLQDFIELRDPYLLYP